MRSALAIAVLAIIACIAPAYAGGRTAAVDAARENGATRIRQATKALRGQDRLVRKAIKSRLTGGKAMSVRKQLKQRGVVIKTPARTSESSESR